MSEKTVEKREKNVLGEKHKSSSKPAFVGAESLLRFVVERGVVVPNVATYLTGMDSQAEESLESECEGD